MTQQIKCSVAAKIEAFDTTMESNTSTKSSFSKTMTFTLNKEKKIETGPFETNMYVWILQISGSEAGGGKFTMMCNTFKEPTDTNEKPPALDVNDIYLVIGQ